MLSIEIVDYGIPIAKDVASITPIQQMFLMCIHKRRQEAMQQKSQDHEESQPDKNQLLAIAKQRMKGG